MVKDLFFELNNIPENIRDIIVFFSTGKDSVVLLDLLSKKMNRIEAVFLYYVPDLKYKNLILNKYEKEYNIKIHQYPQYDVSEILKKHCLCSSLPKTKPIHLENFLRDKFNISYVAYGYKRSDSVFRSGILNNSNCINGVNKKERRIYPLKCWTDKDIFKYIKNNKLYLSFEYDYGYRDINIFSQDALNFIKEKSLEDYQKIISFYPFLKYAELKK